MGKTQLNKGEKDFLQYLRAFVKESDVLDGKDIFLLRNLSVKGVGFFMESAAFYPDFILWVVDGKKQHIYFLDPKGIQYGRRSVAEDCGFERVSGSLTVSLPPWQPFWPFAQFLRRKGISRGQQCLMNREIGEG